MLDFHIILIGLYVTKLPLGGVLFFISHAKLTTA